MGMMASAVLGLAGTAVQAFGSIEAGNYQAQVAQNNAVIAGENAGMSIQSGEISSANQSLQYRATIGKQKAAQGASGIDVNSGSAAAVRAGTDVIGQMDSQTIRSNAAKEAYGYLSQQTQDIAEAQQAQSAGIIGAFGDVLSGAFSIGSDVAKYNAMYGPYAAGTGATVGIS